MKNELHKTNDTQDNSRRDFLKKTSTLAVAAATPLLIPKGVYASTPAKETEIRLALIGCGGRGQGAIGNALNSNSVVKVVALADLTEDITRSAQESLMTQWANQGKAEIPNQNCFFGPESYLQVCEHSDVDLVVHTTPPGIRHLTLRAAVENGKHSFVEKPVCVDPASYRHVLESGEMASQKGLAIVSGTQYRRETSYKEAIQKLHEGIIGKITSAFAYYCSGTLWLRGTPDDWKKWGGISSMEYQMRNWLYFNWLSGDHIAEQAVHNIDAINWGLQGPPVSAFGSGGRIARTDPTYGNVYDNFSIDYDYPNNVRVGFKCRQIAGAKGIVINRFYGSEGMMEIRPNPGATRTMVLDLEGNRIWSHNGRNNNAPYEQEHIDLITSIRDGSPIQEIQEVADSSLTAVIGREAAYSGQEVSFNWAAQESKQDLLPEDLSAAQHEIAPVPIPGVYQLT